MEIPQFATLIVAAVLIFSGILKHFHRASPQEWEDLGVPKALRHPLLIRLHPWAEILLGAGLASIGGAAGAMVASVATLLLCSYTGILWRAQGKENLHCSCFGAPAPVTPVQIARNVWLVVLAAIAILGAHHSPRWGGAAIQSVSRPQELVLAGLVATTVTVIAKAQWGSPPPPAGGADWHMRTPSVPVTLADGTTVTLRQLTSTTPLVLFYVSPYCESCQAVLEKMESYRRLLPEVELRYLLAQPPHQTSLTQREEPQSVHDPNRYLRDSFADQWPTPTAVLLGANGVVAGGPASGHKKIDQFIQEIYTELNGVEPPRD